MQRARSSSERVRSTAEVGFSWDFFGMKAKEPCDIIAYAEREMRYLQLEKGESIDKKDIIGLFDIESASVSEPTRALFRRKEDEHGVVSLSNDLPKSFILCDGEFTDTVYISGISTESIKKRISGGIKPLWEKEKKSDK